jgi:hypothetical protein
MPTIIVYYKAKVGDWSLIDRFKKLVENEFIANGFKVLESDIESESSSFMCCLKNTKFYYYFMVRNEGLQYTMNMPIQYHRNMTYHSMYLNINVY